MDILEMGSALLSDKLSANVDTGTIKSALGDLLSDGSGGIDLAGLAGRIASSGQLSELLGTWLGDGANAPISADSIMDIFGSDKVSAFAERLGVNAGEAADGLSAAIPNMLDKSSSGGSLLDMAGGAGGLLSAAKSFFK